MSPEQARGQAGRQADRHLGVRLRALRDADGPSAVRRRHDLGHHRREFSSASRTGRRCRLQTPASRVTRVLQRCLDKDPKRRLHDIADARIEIDDVLSGASADACGDGGRRSTACPSAMGDRGRRVGRGAHRRRRADVDVQDGAADTDRAAAHLAHDDRIVGHGGGHSQRQSQPGDHARRHARRLRGQQRRQLFVRPLDRLDSTRDLHGRCPSELGLRLARWPMGRVRRGRHAEEGGHHRRAGR